MTQSGIGCTSDIAFEQYGDVHTHAVRHTECLYIYHRWTQPICIGTQMT